MKSEHKKACLNRLKTVRGHLNGVIAMVEDERYCPTVMKQVSALQAALERVNRILLQNHLETCVPHAIAEGRGDHIVEELLETLRYTEAVTGPAHSVEATASGDGAVRGGDGTSRAAASGGRS